jgi:hypothetical protein
MDVSTHISKDSKGHILVEIIPPEEGPPPALDICLAMDVSGSMGDPANKDGPEGVNLFTKLDLAKRGTELLIQALTAEDCLSIVTFSTDAVCVLPRVSMNSTGKVAATHAVAGMYPGGGTDLWAGLSTGLTEVETREEGRMAVTLLLTDGQPTNSPPDGEVRALTNYHNSSKRVTHSKLVIMGFGYDVNSNLLFDLVNAHGPGNNFVFVPDGTMLLTSFTNIIANLKSTFARNVRASIQGADTDLGDLLYGHPRHITLDGGGLNELPEVVTGYHLAVAAKKKAISSVGTRCQRPDAVVLRELHRSQAVAALAKATRIATMNISEALECIRSSVKHALDTSAPHPIVEDLLGEVASAFSAPDAWQRWGAHYARALLSFHRAEACSNFKDPGLNAYGGGYTKRLREAISTMCDNLPVPKPSILPRGVQWGVAVPQTDPQSFRNAFNNQYGGCIAHGSMICMAGGGEKSIQEISKGDRVLVPGGGEEWVARVVCKVMTTGVETVSIRCPSNPTRPLDITPWHPVQDPGDGTWKFPADLTESEKTREPVAVYNLVLDLGHIVVANGIHCVTLGHGFQEDKVRHPFYGTRAVIDALSILPGWDDGLVELGNGGKPIVNNNGEMIAFSVTP